MTGFKFEGTSEEYGRLLSSMRLLNSHMVVAYREEDFDSVGRIADEIGKTCAPDDERTASIIAYLVRDVASDHFWGGIHHQIDNLRKERDRKLG